MVQNELTHWGVKGMKWGVRRTPKQLANARDKKLSEPAHDDYKKAHDSKNVKNMSDKELRERLNRLQMEQQYSKMSTTDVNKGKQYIDKVIKAGTTIAAITTTALTVYNNINKIKDIIDKIPGPVLKEPPIRA